MMRTRAVVVAVLLGAVGLLAGMLPSANGGTPTSSSSSGGCLPPTLSVDLWTLGFPSSRGSIETRQRDCEILCASHQRKCRRVVRLSRTCNSGMVGTIAQLLQDVCATEPDVLSRRQCRREARAFKDDVRACVTEDALTARDCCENNFQACVSHCDDKGFEPQQCFTGGSCLFQLFNSTVP